MTIRVSQGDVLDAKAEVLFVTASTEPPKKNGRKADVLGAVGSHFLRRIGTEAAEEFGEELDVPIRQGTVQAVAVDEGSGVAFKHVFVLGALSHLENAPHKSLMTRALAEGLRVAEAAGATRVALSLPKGGWRLKAVDAAAALLGASDEHPAVEVTVYCPNDEETREVEALLRSLGVR